MGTVNVFAKELGLPMGLKQSFQILRMGKEMTIDLPCVECCVKGRPERRYFAHQLGPGPAWMRGAIGARGTGISEEKVGAAGLRVGGDCGVARTGLQKSRSRMGTESAAGQLVLVGNGRHFTEAGIVYFPKPICVMACWKFAFSPEGLMVDHTRSVAQGYSWLVPSFRQKVAKCFRAKTLTLRRMHFTNTDGSGWGKNIGHLAGKTFSVQQKKLRVVVP